jgi:HEAT repeat protein
MGLTLGAPLMLAGPPANTEATSPKLELTLDQWRELMKNLNPREPVDGQILDGLRRLIRDPSVPWFTRRQAALTLGRIGKPAAAAVTDLIELLDEQAGKDETSPRYWALKALSLFGPVAADWTPRFSAILADRTQPWTIRALAAETLARIGAAHPQAIPALINAAGAPSLSSDPNDDEELRVVVIEALELPAPSGALPVLMSACESDSERVRRAAAKTIGVLGPSASPAAELLASLIVFDSSPYVVQSAADALPRLGGDAVPVLAALLKQESPDVRKVAAEGFGKLGPVGRGHREELIASWKDPDSAVAVAALRSSWLLGESPATLLSLLLDGLASDDRLLRKGASDLLIQMNAAAEPARSGLERLLETGSPETRIAVRRVLSHLDRITDPLSAN